MEIVFIDEKIKPPFNDLFGIEKWRFDVWGSKAIEGLGCKILPSLRKSDIYAEGYDLKSLESELSKIISEIKNISKELKVDEETFYFRLRNALEAVRVVKQYPNGGVYIG